MNILEKISKIFKKNKVDDLIAITSFFNPSNYKNKKQNFIKFRDNLRKQGVPLLVVECAFGDSDYEIEKEDAEIVIRVRSNSRIWQKERLLNIALENIPKQYTKFASLDCDIIFKNNNWAIQTSKLLDKYPVVQPFEYAIRLNKDQLDAMEPVEFGPNNGQRIHCLVKAMNGSGKKFIYGLGKRGTTGFAWAFRKDAFPYFYDGLIVGSGDSVMAHAFYGIHHLWWKSNLNMINHQKEYIDKIYKIVKGNVGFSKGTILHLWHGERKDRAHNERYKILLKKDYNPYEDLTLNKHGCWEVRKDIEQAISNYFNKRKEE